MRHQEGGSEGKHPASSRTWPTGLEVRDTAVQRTLTGEAGRAEVAPEAAVGPRLRFGQGPGCES